MTVIANLPDIRPSLLLDFTSGQVDPRIQCVRASAASCYGPSGKQRTVAANVPRIDYDPTTGKCLGLFIEASAINKSLNPDDANLWQNASSVIANNEIAPDGTLTADTIINPLDSGTQNMQFVMLQDGVTETFSRYFCKRSTAQWVRLRVSMVGSASASIYFDIKNKVIGVKSSEFTGALFEDLGDWVRFSVQYTPAATQGGSRSYCYNPVAANNNPDPAIDKTLIVWRSQIEVGSIATSPIKTEGSAVTRAADNIQLPLGDWFNPDEGTFVVEYELSKNAASSCAIDLYKSTDPTSNRIGMRYSSGGHAQYQVTVGGASMSIAPTGANVPGRYRRSISYKVGEFLQAINGVVSSPSVGVGIPTVDRFLIGSETTPGGNALNDTIKSIAYYPRAFTAVQHQRATAL